MKRYCSIIFLISYLSACTSKPDQKIIAKTTDQVSVQNNPTEVAIPSPIRIDTISKNNFIYILDSLTNIKLNAVNIKEIIKISGHAFIVAGDNSLMHKIQTSLLNITILQPSLFRIDAYKNGEAAEVEVLSGALIITKNYPSPYSAPDTVSANQLYMINRRIDLSEIENIQTNALQQWWNKVSDARIK